MGDFEQKGLAPFKETGIHLSEQHWGYIKNLLVAHGVTQEEIEMVEFHYKTAFVHGFKHGREFEQGRESCEYWDNPVAGYVNHDDSTGMGK